MIQYERFYLNNGLEVIVHEDPSTPMAVLNILYKVGARNEKPDKTGFAHLFEHLMFGGTKAIPVFDTPLQMAGGENNAFTSNDITNYYNVVPAVNLETAFWLESDRMRALDFSQRSLDVQRKVVVEEFKENYLNQPYGDVWHLLRKMVYKTHPYQWPTIGKEISHIEDAQLSDVKDFFYRFYRPNNAVMVVAGNVKSKEILSMSESWFGDISPGEAINQDIPEEPKQKEHRFHKVEVDVPVTSIYQVYQMCGRTHSDYHATDLISDVLSNGRSSRLYQNLVMKSQLFTELDAYILGSKDKGMFIIEGKPSEGISIDAAEAAIEKELQQMIENLVPEKELQRYKNKLESNYQFSNMSLLSRAMNLAMYSWLGDPNLLNTDFNNYLAVSPEDLQRVSKELFRRTNCSTLHYISKN